MAIDLKPEMLLYQFKTPTLTNSFYMIIMTESSCNVKYIYLKQYVPLSMYIRKSLVLRQLQGLYISRHRFWALTDTLRAIYSIRYPLLS